MDFHRSLHSGPNVDFLHKISKKIFVYTSRKGKSAKINTPVLNAQCVQKCNYRADNLKRWWALMTVYFVLEIKLKMALMKVDVSTTAFILTFISILQCNAWLLPPASLVHQFAKINNRFSIVFHLPSHDNDNIIHAYRKMFRYNWGQHWACDA